MGKDFYQTAPILKNQYDSDEGLKNFLKNSLPPQIQLEIEKDLFRFGERVVSDVLAMAEQAEREVPVHIPFDPWGRRIDEIRVSSAWTALAGVAAEEGLVALGYERKYGAHSRLIQFAKLYLFHPSSAFASCPLAMTDGAARAIELYGDDSLKADVFSHLTSRDPKKFWTSGQWMTERTGGSDVSGTSTVARPLGGDRYELSGTKWFTSATTSQVAMTLARIEGHPEGSRGLSLFCIETHDENGHLKKMEVLRLKEKLGTKALPTAELSLHGTPAKLVGGEGGGVKKISSLFNITRMYNAVCALGATRRVLVLAKDYSQNRVAFGRKIVDHSLHAETLSDLVVEFEGIFQLVFHSALLLGKDETGKAKPDESALLRLLTPLAKLYSAKSCIAITSEVIEIFGGAGYIEDTGIPRWLRDAQVFSIWEGTTNVLSLDVLRAIEKEKAFEPFIADILQRISTSKMKAESDAVQKACADLRHFLAEGTKDPELLQSSARYFAYSLARTFIASLLLEKAFDPRSEILAKRWCANGLTHFLQRDDKSRGETLKILEF